jgi:hypothetical protein
MQAARLNTLDVRACCGGFCRRADPFGEGPGVRKAHRLDPSGSIAGGKHFAASLPFLRAIKLISFKLSSQAKSR